MSYEPYEQTIVCGFYMTLKNLEWNQDKDMNHYYGLRPFSVGKKVKCMKDKNNPYDSEAIKAVMKDIGTVGYIANNPYTTATGTMSAGRIYEKVKKKFVVEVMFITSLKVICI